jgi:hypothetical protein
MISKLERLMLISGNPEAQTSPNPGFVMCPFLSLPQASFVAWQEQVYRWAYAQVQAQVAASRGADLRAIFDPSLN